MNVERSKNAVLNVFFALLLQLVSAVSGLIVPRLLIQCYGSEVNGLIASITQFLAYISLLEAGVGGVIRAALYKPLASNNKEKISGIIKAAKQYYGKIGVVFLIYLVILCAIFPVFAKSDFSVTFIETMILIISIGTILQYFVSLSYISLVSADQKGRIIYLLDSITLFINVIVTYILVSLNAPIHIVKAISCLVFALKPIFLVLYVNYKYHLTRDCEADTTAIQQRFNGLAHHIAFFIHSNTDILILTFFTNLTTVSIYSIYRSVIVGIEKIVISVSDGCAASIGNLLAVGNKKEIDNSIDLFEFVQTFSSCILFSVTYLMLIPFLNLYTTKITDGNYIQPIFGSILVLAEFIFCIREIYITIALNGGKYKETQNGAIIECIVNLVISVLLVNQYGLIGVAIGTAIAMSVRCVFDVAYLSKNLIHRSVVKFLKSITVCTFSMIVSILFCRFAFEYKVISWLDWFEKAIISGFTVLCLSSAVYFCFYKKIFISVCNRIIKRFKK